MISNWHERFVNLAKHFAEWSKDPSTKVGAVIVDPTGRHLVGHGYNGFPKGVQDLPERYADRPTKYKMIVHAEVNAILDAGRDAQDGTLYSTFMPCPQCAAMIIQAGISAVFALTNTADERWKAEFEITKTMFEEAGVALYVVKDNEKV